MPIFTYANSVESCFSCYRTLPKRPESTGATSVAGTPQAAVFSPARMVSAASAENDFERRDFAQKNPIEGKP
jgi:hypothetical protein